jgi:hypothetical protein
VPLARRTHRLAGAGVVATALVGGTLGLLPGTSTPAAAGLVAYADCAELVRATGQRLRAGGALGGGLVSPARTGAGEVVPGPVELEVAVPRSTPTVR